MQSIPAPPIDLVAIGPVLAVSITAMTALLLELVWHGQQKARIAYVCLAGTIVAALLTLPLWNQGRAPAYFGMVMADNFTVFVSLVSLAITGMTLLMAPSFLEQAKMHHGEFYALLMLAAAGMLTLGASGDLIMVFLGIELLSIALYVLAGFARGRLASEESALKYFLLGSFSIGFFVYGTALIYGATGSTNLAQIGKAITSQNAQNPLLLIGMALLLVGFGFKLAFVPFHQWTPDVYDGAPTLVTAFMAVGTKAAVFAALIRVLSEALPALRGDWSTILWALAALTMVIGNLVAIAQSEIKRLLAYSSIGQAGYVLTAVYAGNPDGWSGTLFYLLAYTAMNLGVFAVIMALGLAGDNNRRTANYVGLFHRRPLLAVALTVFLLSLGGFPPTAGFWAKFYAFHAAIGRDTAGVILAIVGVISSIIAAYYYLRVAIQLYRRPEGSEENAAILTGSLPVPLPLMATVIIALILTLQIGLFPAAQLEAARQAIPRAAQVAAR